jgi:hypothetical protein
MVRQAARCSCAGGRAIDPCSRSGQTAMNSRCYVWSRGLNCCERTIDDNVVADHTLFSTVHFVLAAACGAGSNPRAGETGISKKVITDYHLLSFFWGSQGTNVLGKLGADDVQVASGEATRQLRVGKADFFLLVPLSTISYHDRRTSWECESPARPWTCAGHPSRQVGVGQPAERNEGQSAGEIDLGPRGRTRLASMQLVAR